MQKRSKLILLASALLVTVPLLQGLFSHPASAAQITLRSLTLQAGASDGGSKPHGTVKHFFQFTLPTSGNVGSIKFQYCTLAAGTCTMPSNMVSTGATLAAQTGETGFTMVNTANGAPYITRTAASVTGPQAVTYQFDNIVNPALCPNL
jgi:hypothetical protein